MWSEAVRMLAAGAIVAAVALPVGVFAWLLARRRGEPVLPAWKPWRVPWGGFEVGGVAFLIISAAVPGALLLALSEGGFYRQVYGPDFPGIPTTRPPAVEVSAAVAGLPAATAAHDELAATALLRELWARSLALPIILGLLYLAARSLYPQWRPAGVRGLAGKVTLAVAAWAVLTPLVLGINLLVNLV